MFKNKRFSKKHLHLGAVFLIGASVAIMLFAFSFANGFPAPTCDGQVATVYVNTDTNKIVGGPDDGNTYTDTLKGTNSGEVMVGTDGDDKIKGKDGDDLICALDGNNEVKGGKGNDTIYTGGGNDDIKGNNGNDVIYAGNGNNEIDGGKGNDEIYGGHGIDDVNANKGDDIVCTYGGNDEIYGGHGNDKLDADGGDSDKINGQKNIDICYGGENVSNCETTGAGPLTECTAYTPPDVVLGCVDQDDPNSAPGNDDYKSYEFYFEGGFTAIGTATGNTVDVVVDGYNMTLHISCSDHYFGPDKNEGTADDGYGEKDDPTQVDGHPRVTSYEIWKYKIDEGQGTCILDKTCSGTPSIDSDCGDGIVEGLEECDDGNNNQNDSCSNQCEDRTPICHATGSQSNPYIFLWVNNSAIDGQGANDHTNHPDDIIPITDENGDQTIDIDDCGYAAGLICGDGDIDFGEECDDGNNDNGDGCDSQCVIELPIVDLGITKADDPDPVVAGEELTYTIEVTNGGPDDSTGYTVSDYLSVGVTYSNATSPDGSCIEAAGVITCDMDPLANGNSATITVYVDVDTDTVGTITNNVEISDSNEEDPNPANDDADEDTEVVAETDLAVEKNDSVDPVTAGQGNIFYTIEVTNNGPSDSTGYTLVDTLPAGVTFFSSTPGSPTCDYAAGIVSCNMDGLDVDDIDIINITVLVDSDASDPLVNTVDIEPNEFDINLSDNTDIEETEVIITYDLFIVKDDLTDPIIPGMQEDYEIRIFNNGPSDSNGYTVVDTLPVGVTFISATSADGTCLESPAGIITCDMTSISYLGEHLIEVAVDIDVGTLGTIVNESEITAVAAGDIETVPENNFEDEETLVLGPEVGAVKVEDDEDNVVYAEQEVTFTITLLNNGTTSATNTTVYDELDLQLTNLNVQSIVGCGASPVDNSSHNPEILNISNLEVGVYPASPACVITFTTNVIDFPKIETIIPNEASITYDGGPDLFPASDDLIVGGRGGGGGSRSKCGNGNIESGEQCDDGNRKNGDGCSSGCKLEPPPPTGEPEHEAPQETCLQYNESREILYTDNQDIWTKDYVDFLSRVYLTDKDQYILSGDGSFYGGHEATFESTVRPLQLTNRFETVKIALTSFCIPIYTNEERKARPQNLRRPDFPDFPSLVNGAHPDFYRAGRQNTEFIANVFYTAYDKGIIDGRYQGDTGEWLAEWESPVTRAEILKIFVNAADYNTENSFMYTDEELDSFADEYNTTVEQLSGDQLLASALQRWGSYYIDVDPTKWYGRYLPMVVKNQIVADVCLPQYIADDPTFDITDEMGVRVPAAAFSCNGLEEEICIPVNVANAPGFDDSEESVRELVEENGYNCPTDEISDVVENSIVAEEPEVARFNFPPARFAFPDNPAVRGEVFALDARMIWITAATDLVNKHSNTKMKNDALLEVLFTQLQENERSEFLFAILNLVNKFRVGEESTLKEVPAPAPVQVGGRNIFSSVFHILVLGL